ncbi:MAG: hypothetical protein MUF18_01135, partial [Fimbriiglobus sp.]|nr:hypothetical protein [Fimbriiglobus sp.]
MPSTSEVPIPRFLRPLAVAIPLAGVVLVLVGTSIPRPVTAQPSAPGLTNDLALIPAEALGFAHVRVAEVWKGEAMKPLRKAIERAGPAFFETLDRDFTPAPSTLERVTTVALPSSSMDMGGPRTVTVLAFSSPFEV